MRLLVTGGAGYLGSVVCRRLVAAGHAVLILDDLRAGKVTAIPEGTEFVQGDMADQPLLADLLPGIDAVLHFAGSIEVGESMRRPLTHFQNNVAKTTILLESMLAHGVSSFIFSSTAAIYGEPESIPVPVTHPLRPANPYGESKLMVERMLHWLHVCNGFRYASLRYFNAAGGPFRGGAVNLIPIVLEVAAGIRPHLEIFGTDYPTRDGTAVRDYIHVEDLATAHVLTLEALAYRDRLIYNLGNGVGFTVREVVEAARSVTGAPIPVVEFPRRSGDPAEMVADADPIRTELGWQPEYTDLRSIISDAWEHFRREKV